MAVAKRASSVADRGWEWEVCILYGGRAEAYLVLLRSFKAMDKALSRPVRKRLYGGSWSSAASATS